MTELQEYLDKRNFSETPEPEPTGREPEETNRFVIQKHMARREHYDFRLLDSSGAPHLVSEEEMAITRD